MDEEMIAPQQRSLKVETNKDTPLLLLLPPRENTKRSQQPCMLHSPAAAPASAPEEQLAATQHGGDAVACNPSLQARQRDRVPCRHATYQSGPYPAHSSQAPRAAVNCAQNHAGDHKLLACVNHRCCRPPAAAAAAAAPAPASAAAPQASARVLAAPAAHAQPPPAHKRSSSVPARWDMSFR